MLYNENIFNSNELDSDVFIYNNFQPEISDFLVKMEKLINEQYTLISQINLESNNEEILDRLYRNNFVLYGMTKIYEINKLTHLLEILNFTFDLIRRIGKINEFSTDYLIKLFYDKLLIMIDELKRKNSISFDCTDLIEEGKIISYHN